MNTKNTLLFQDRNRYFVYDTNINRMSTLSKELYEIVKDPETHTEEIDKSPFLNELREKGFFAQSEISKIEHPENPYLEDILECKVKQLILQVTQSCNFRCEYCVYSGTGTYENRKHENKHMSWEMMKKGIDFLYHHSMDSTEVGIAFYGGEPLLRYEQIVRAVEYANSIFAGKEVLYSITTNGSLLTKEIAKFCIDNGFQINISLDGPPAVHDLHRKFASGEASTYKKIYENIMGISEEYPEFLSKIGFLMVLDPANELSCVQDYISSEEMMQNSSVSAIVISDINRRDELHYDPSFVAQWQYEKFLYFLYLLRRNDDISSFGIYKTSAKGITNFLTNQRMQSVKRGGLGHPSGPCIPGQSRLFMNVSGNLYPCEKTNEDADEMVIGDIGYGFNIDKVKQMLNVGAITAEECKECCAFNYCFICSNLVCENNKISKEKKLELCQSVRDSTEILLKDMCTLNEFGLKY